MTKFQKGNVAWNKGIKMPDKFKSHLIGNKHSLGVKHSLESIKNSSNKRTKYPVINGRKVCSDCGTEKEVSEFHKKAKSRDGICGYCKACSTIRHQKYYYENREELKRKIRENNKKPHVKMNKRNKNLLVNYGITEDVYQDMLKNQKYSCAICGVNQESLTYKLYVDHCHTTKKVRGLLCKHCNSAIGLFKDDKDTMINAINYISQYD